MNRFSKLTVTAAALTVVIASFGTSAFADSRLRDETSLDGRSVYENRDRDDRDNERVTVEGRISNITRERDGYRVTLEHNGNAFWVPERSVRGRDFRIGTFIRLGGIFRRGAVYVDVIDYPAVSRVYVRGSVERIDLRRGLMYVRDEFSRRVIPIDAHKVDQRSRRFDLDDLHRGDRVEVWGDWRGGGVLEAARVELRGERR